MTHFVDAREQSLVAIGEADVTAETVRTCLIIDLQGKMRVLAELAPTADPKTFETLLKTKIGNAAGVFWSGEVWLQSAADGLAKRALCEQVWKEASAIPSGQTRTYVLDRRLSKDAWLGTPIDPPWPLNEHTPPIISFYSFKGGVGRTTTLLALAVNLARAGKKVTVLDFDLEAPGAGGVLAPPSGVPAGLGLVEFLLESRVTKITADDLADFYHRFDDKAVIVDGEPLTVVPSGTLDRWYLEKLARVNYEHLYQAAVRDSGSASSLHELFRLFKSRLGPDFFLIDSRAGLHDLGGLTLSGIAHLHVLFGLDSKQSWDGLSLVVSHLGRDMVLAGKKQRDCAVVHSMVSSGGTTREEELKRFKERSFQVFSENYYDPEEATTGEWPLPDPEAAESPHFPMSLSWNDRVKGFYSLGSIVDVLTTSEYRRISEQILEKVDRAL